MTDNLTPPEAGEHKAKTSPLLNSPLYDKLKFLAMILLPALGALYFGLAGIWGLPNADKVVGSIMVIDLFLGTLLGISGAQYKNLPVSHDGFLSSSGVDPDTGIPNLALTITKPPEDLLAGDTVLLKVERPNVVT